MCRNLKIIKEWDAELWLVPQQRLQLWKCMASIFMRIVNGAKSDALFCPLGEILLFGNEERWKVSPEIEEICLDYHVERLAKCLGPEETGWRHWNICFYCITTEGLYPCLLYPSIDKSHFATKFPKHVSAYFLNSFESLLRNGNVISEELENLFSCQQVAEDLNIPEVAETMDYKSLQLCMRRSECLSVLKVPLVPPNILFIEEAARVKECELTIPLQEAYLRG